ncbi:MAG: hypothetical protein IJG70_00280, partial [Kiritimatiellae bacterium]|nr:hypothetical protein [Kiritimatiellia bacterium]
EFARSAGRAARQEPTTPDCQTQRYADIQRTAKLSFNLSKFRLLWQTAEKFGIAVCPLKKRYYIASGAQANYRTAIITTFWPIISAKIRSLRPRGRQIGVCSPF